MNIAKDVVSSIKDASKNKTSAYDTQATVTRIEGNTAWVHIPGGVNETPVKLTVNASEGDAVQVRVANGTAWITGNASAPPTDDKKANIAYTLASTAAEEAQTAHNAAQSAVADAAIAHEAAQVAQDSIKSVVTGAQTVEKAVSVMQTALEAVVDYDPTNDTVTEYFWHDANGAHVLGATSGYRNDLDSTGMKIMDTTSETSVAEFTATGAQIGQNVSGMSRAVISAGGMRLYRHGGSEDKIMVDFGYDDNGNEPYYTIGERLSGSSLGGHSVAEGRYTTASGDLSHAEGLYTVASGRYGAHAEGQYTTASGESSHAQNEGTIASKANQTAIGKYNIEDTATATADRKALIIGNGTSDSARSNALTVDWSGNVEMALDTTATSGTDKEIYDALASLGWDSDVIV